MTRPTIQSRADAAEAARTLHTLRESIKQTEHMQQDYRDALEAWMAEHGETEIGAEGMPTLRRAEEGAGWEWNVAGLLRDGHIETLVHLGLVSIRTSAYDEHVAAHGPLGLKEKYARQTRRVAMKYDRERR